MYMTEKKVNIEGAGPLSYTHLDVYQRQDRDRCFQQRVGSPGIYQKLADRSDRHGVSVKY